MLKFLRENAGNSFFWLGFILIFFGVVIFFGAKPKHMNTPAIGESWFISAPLILVGSVALSFDRYLHK